MATWEVGKLTGAALAPVVHLVAKVTAVSTPPSTLYYWELSRIIGTAAVAPGLLVAGVTATVTEVSTQSNLMIASVTAEADLSVREELYYWNGATWVHCDLFLYEGDGFWNQM